MKAMANPQSAGTPGPTGDVSLRAVDLTMVRGSVVTLDALSLEVSAGKVLSVLGPNGAGKTTTINLFMGFIKPTSGRAEVCGIDVARNPRAARKALAYIPEVVSLYGHLTGIENLAYFAELGGIKDLSRSELSNLLAQAGLQSTAFDRRCATYSKGMRQKVCVALALAKNAKAMLLDEPTSGLDPYAAKEFSILIARLAEQGVGALIATHDLLLAKELSDEILILVGGKVRHRLETRDLTIGELESIYLAELDKAAEGPGDPR
jgi:ABC-2 type transport system ATP-binding protein